MMVFGTENKRVIKAFVSLFSCSCRLESCAGCLLEMVLRAAVKGTLSAGMCMGIQILKSLFRYL